jgi:hypothetical protein
VECYFNCFESGEMRRLVQISAILGMSVILAGCGIGLGLFPKSSYETLHPKPYRDYWIKGGTTAEDRQADWVVCGGRENGNFSLHPDRMLPGETNNQAYSRQSIALERCMLRAGYRYTGNCSNAYMKTQPLCGAP